MAINFWLMGSWMALTSISVFVLIVLISLMKRSLEGSSTPGISLVTIEKLWAISRLEGSQERLNALDYVGALDLAVEAVRDLLNQLMRTFLPGSEDYNIAETAYILAETKVVDAGSVDQIFFLNKLRLKALTSEITEKDASTAIQIATKFVYKQRLGKK